MLNKIKKPESIVVIVGKIFVFITFFGALFVLGYALTTSQIEGSWLFVILGYMLFAMAATLDSTSNLKNLRPHRIYVTSSAIIGIGLAFISKHSLLSAYFAITSVFGMLFALGDMFAAWFHL